MSVECSKRPALLARKCYCWKNNTDNNNEVMDFLTRSTDRPFLSFLSTDWLSMLFRHRTLPSALYPCFSGFSLAKERAFLVNFMCKFEASSKFQNFTMHTKLLQPGFLAKNFLTSTCKANSSPLWSEPKFHELAKFGAGKQSSTTLSQHTRLVSKRHACRVARTTKGKPAR